MKLKKMAKKSGRFERNLNNHSNDFKYLIKNNLFCCTKDCERNELKDLIICGLDLNTYDKKYNTPLHRSIFFKNTNCVKLMLEQRELDITICNVEKDTALKLASKMGEYKIVKFLLKRSDLGKDDRIESEKIAKLKCSEKQYEEKEGKESLKRYKKICKAFRNQNKLDDEFISAIKIKDFDGVLKSISSGININIVKDNELSAIQIISRNGKNDSRNGKILKLLCNNRARFTHSDIENADPKYKCYLNRKFVEINCDRVITELYSTEKSFLEEIKIFICVFIENAKSKLGKLVKSKKNRAKISKLFDLIYKIKDTSELFLRNMIKEFSVNSTNTKKHLIKPDNILKHLHMLDYTSYSDYIKCYIEVKEIIEKDGKKSLFTLYMNDQKKYVPYPKTNNFSFIINLPYNRIVKYRDIIKRLRKPNTECSIKFEKYETKFDETLNSIDNNLEMKKRKVSIQNIKNLMDKNYSIKSEVSENLLKSYQLVYFDINCYNVLEKKFIKKDLFIFDDNLFFVEGKKKFERRRFENTKFIFVINSDNVRITIYDFSKKEKNVVLISKPPRTNSTDSDSISTKSTSSSSSSSSLMNSSISSNSSYLNNLVEHSNYPIYDVFLYMNESKCRELASTIEGFLKIGSPYYRIRFYVINNLHTKSEFLNFLDFNKNQAKSELCINNFHLEINNLKLERFQRSVVSIMGENKNIEKKIIRCKRQSSSLHRRQSSSLHSLHRGKSRRFNKNHK